MRRRPFRCSSCHAQLEIARELVLVPRNSDWTWQCSDTAACADRQAQLRLFEVAA
jgi:hypothetical protein